MVRGVIVGWSGLLVTGGLAVTLSCRLSAMFLLSGEKKDASPFSVVGKALGASRTALSASLLRGADRYFHLGRLTPPSEAFTNAWYQRIARTLSPQTHAHATGDQVKDMMAQIWFSLLADPHNVDAYLIAAYWLAGPDINRPDMAQKVLQEGQRRNPRHHEFPCELALLALKTGRLDAARTHLEAGLRLWPGVRDPASKQTRLDKETLLTYRALLHEHDGRIAEALADWREVLSIFPSREEVHQRVKDLAAGRNPSIGAAHYWRLLLRESDRRRGACPREHGDTAHETHDHNGSHHSPDHG